MSLHWQIERVITEIREATGTPDGYVHIPHELLSRLAQLGYNQGQIDSMQDTLERMKKSKEEEDKLRSNLEAEVAEFEKGN